MIQCILRDKRFILFLFIVNLLGTIYGFIWYEPQLIETPWYFLAFVPDSPTASLFFTIFLFFALLNRNIPYIEALGIVTLFKYGVWAVAMNLFTLYVDGSLSWQGYMLIASHAGMAIQGLLYAPQYKIRMKHLLFAAIWTVHNDIIDYVFGMMPVYSSLTDHLAGIGYFTFWLSLISIYLAYRLTIVRENKPMY